MQTDEPVQVPVPDQLPPQAMDFYAMTEPDFWCTISYYELNSRVGEIFNVPSSSPTLTVDGFANPDANRLCLGRFNNVHRDTNVQNTRASIGKGGWGGKFWLKMTIFLTKIEFPSFLPSFLLIFLNDSYL